MDTGAGVYVGVYTVWQHTSGTVLFWANWHTPPGWDKSRNTSGCMLFSTSCDSPAQCSILLDTEIPQRSLPTASVSAGVHDAPYVPINVCKQPFVFLLTLPKGQHL